MPTLLGPVRRWLSQDTARTNAAQASLRLMHERRRRQDRDAYLERVLPRTVVADRPSDVGRANRAGRVPGSR